MMSLIFDQSIECANTVLSKLKSSGKETNGHFGDFPSTDHTLESDRYRKAHLSIVDARSTRKVWMMHCTVFPHVDDPSPIFGFDIIAGPSRASGAFQDFSNGGRPDHPMMLWFAERSNLHSWKKDRNLPDWAERIFSPSMIAIGSVGSDELAQFISVGLENLDYYLKHVGSTRTAGTDYSDVQNFYCTNQSLNPHTPQFMMSLGLSKEDADSFMKNILFPLI